MEPVQLAQLLKNDVEQITAHSRNLPGQDLTAYEYYQSAYESFIQNNPNPTTQELQGAIQSFRNAANMYCTSKGYTPIFKIPTQPITEEPW